MTEKPESDPQDWPAFIKAHFSSAVPFVREMGVTVEDTREGYALISMPLVPGRHANSYGFAHGGVAALLVDMAAGVAFRTLRSTVVTIETTATYLAPIPLPNTVRAEARVTQRGRRILHADVEIRIDDGTLAARGRAIYMATGPDRGVYPAPPPRA